MLPAPLKFLNLLRMRELLGQVEYLKCLDELEKIMGSDGLVSDVEEQTKEIKITCDFCGPRALATWDVVTNEGEVVFVCHKHHAVLLEKDIVFIERRIGQETWEER